MLETPDDLFQRMAWKLKAKGITIYRYNSKLNQVLNLSEKHDKIPALLQEGTTDCKVCAE